MPSDPDVSPEALNDPARAHPFAVMFEIGQTARTMLFPALIAAFAGGGGDVPSMILWGLAVLAIPSVLYAIASYLRYQYRLGRAELILESGVLSRQRRVIPTARLQNIALRQNALHRLFGVVELRAETAAGGEEEVSLVLARERAVELRGALLARREGASDGAFATAAATAPSARTLARLSMPDILKAGATSNEAGLLAALVAGGIQLASRLRVPLPEFLLDPRLLLPGLPDALAVAAVVGLFLVVGWLFSVGGAVARYASFTLERSGDDLRTRHGLLDREQATIPMPRVQAIRVEESAVRRALGLARLTLETAGSAAGRRRGRRAEILLPIGNRETIARILEEVFPGLDYPQLKVGHVHPRARRRAFFRYLVLLLAAGLTLAYALGIHWGWVLPLAALAYPAAALHYRHRGYALHPAYAVARAGFLNRITWVIPRGKVQTLQLRETPIQRRHHLATVVIDTAGGGASVADIGREQAVELLSRLAHLPPAPPPAPRM
jgi:putative membrane protein